MKKIQTPDGKTEYDLSDGYFAEPDEIIWYNAENGCDYEWRWFDRRKATIIYENKETGDIMYQTKKDALVLKEKDKAFGTFYRKARVLRDLSKCESVNWTADLLNTMIELEG